MHGQGIETLLPQGRQYHPQICLWPMAQRGTYPTTLSLSASKPGKVCMIFDCDAKLNNVSLNNQCLQGPDINNKLLHVFLRFRQYEHTVMADVKDMYLQAKIPPQDRNALRFLWTDEDHVKEYRTISHLFPNWGCLVCFQQHLCPP